MFPPDADSVKNSGMPFKLRKLDELALSMNSVALLESCANWKEDVGFSLRFDVS